MHRLTRLAVSGVLTLLALSALALAADNPQMPPGERRAEAFLKILSAPAAEQRSFVQENFTKAAIERRGLDGLVAFLSRGANASFEVFPESGYVVIVLSNKGQGSRDVAQQLIGMVLARR